MTQHEAFVLGCIVTIVVELIVLGALWIARSRQSVEAADEVYGDWPHLERRP
ncbi:MULTISPECIES: hypothetical protein [unclassified Bosea (in: a-proteobacteria)]|uniref:hypothetical protein n=1 Tax=unclassified Bosea (in: a-proteobacteria) TaxID=2653178 RepID=UPI001253175C|nr:MULTISPECIES: hypothetical protein [unclassified Bosea (in: a-proteobacteria)]CAD5254159.1 hypothetical protein BOSE7B_120476 [Bosea sp. 7B]CAD5276948.1 hypothetical protein BOSE21B_30437 [Bosea sp. 21B]VVT59824.1 hypothetical protein BOS5A_210615 [Bosea sp. EC-HK365B]VXC06337.1 hypothetical protein BOSE127_170116 [Bosea sp. 127]